MAKTPGGEIGMLAKIRPVITLLLSISLVLPLMTQREAIAAPPELTMIIGRPNIWSLGQAHYLLANLRNTNRGLAVPTPSLDPNSINGARMEVLRTLTGAEVQVSTPQGLANSVAQQQFQADFNRKQAAITRLDELQRDQLKVVQEIAQLNEALAELGPQPAAADQIKETELKRDELTKKKAAKVELRDAIATQITTVSTQANNAVTLSNLKEAFPLATPSTPTLPSEGIGDIKEIVTKMLNNPIPSADASQKLDNYLNMQYELIAKQLTLLRDEVRADERLVFLELPSSLYTVPNRDDNQMVHIEWTVSDFLKQCEKAGTTVIHGQQAEALKEAVLEAQNLVARLTGKNLKERQRPPITDEYLARFFELIKTDTYRNAVVAAIYAEHYNKYVNEKEELARETKSLENAPEPIRKVEIASVQARTTKMESQVQKAKSQLPKEQLGDIDKFNALSKADKRNIEELKDMVLSHPELLSIGWTASTNKTDTSLLRTANTKAKSATTAPPDQKVRCEHGTVGGKSNFRVIDIVPRQSALNVNDVHATQKGFALAAKFLTLFGLGAQVSYQRQRSIYDQFLTQDIFASGFGKGTDKFGWTIGPLPGTKRLAPGPRTTFAILAIPNDAWKITLQATAVAFPRTKDPNDERAIQILTPDQRPVSFDVIVPGEDTEGFKLDSIDYTPVRKGQRVTAILGGYFSPLTGIMVNGIPLKRAVAIAKHESDSTTLPVAADAQGEYEYLSPSQIIVSFGARETDFVGTPLITLVTPEGTSTINFTATTVNGQPDSLQHYSLIEPMFIDAFNIARVEVDSQYLDNNVATGYPIVGRLIGSGFRRGAEFCVNDDCTAVPTFRNTGLYEFTFSKPARRIWTVTYRLGQEIASKDFDKDVDGSRADAPTIDSIENPSTGKAEGLIGGGYTVVIRGNNLHNVEKVFFGKNEVAKEKIHTPKHPNVLLVEVPAAPEGAVQVLLEGTATNSTGQQRDVSNILDFVTPGKATFKYVKPPKDSTKPTPKPKPKPKPKPRQTRRPVTTG